jgi:hypothetical protein
MATLDRGKRTLHPLLAPSPSSWEVGVVARHRVFACCCVLLLAATSCSRSKDTESQSEPVVREPTGTPAAATTDQSAAPVASQAGQGAAPTRTPAATAGTAARSGGDEPSSEGCSSGMTRVCCGAGKQVCGDGEFPSWGPCQDAAGEPLVCSGCSDPQSEFACDAGAQEPDAGQPEPDAGKPLDAGMECGPGMACKPGSIRYCDASRVAEWTFSTCSTEGQWGECVATTIPAVLDGVGGCSATSYSPESCCPQRMLCCQDGAGGLFDPFGGDDCAALSCP